MTFEAFRLYTNLMIAGSIAAVLAVALACYVVFGR